jgi:hypothetical protein
MNVCCHNGNCATCSHGGSPKPRSANTSVSEGLLVRARLACREPHYVIHRVIIDQGTLGPLTCTLMPKGWWLHVFCANRQGATSTPCHSCALATSTHCSPQVRLQLGFNSVELDCCLNHMHTLTHESPPQSSLRACNEFMPKKPKYITPVAWPIVAVGCLDRKHQVNR